MKPLGPTAFDPRLNPWSLYEAATQVRTKTEEGADALEEYATTLADIQALPETAAFRSLP